MNPGTSWDEVTSAGQIGVRKSVCVEMVLWESRRASGMVDGSRADREQACCAGCRAVSQATSPHRSQEAKQRKRSARS